MFHLFHYPVLHSPTNMPWWFLPNLATTMVILKWWFSLYIIPFTFISLLHSTLKNLLFHLFKNSLIFCIHMNFWNPILKIFGCNPYHYLFWYSNYPIFCSGHPFRLAPLPFWHTPFILWLPSYLSNTIRCSRFILYFSYSGPIISQFPRSFGSF